MLELLSRFRTNQRSVLLHSSNKTAMMSHFSVGVHQHSISCGRPRLQRLLRGDDAAEQLSYDDDILSSRRFYSNGKYSRAARN